PKHLGSRMTGSGSPPIGPWSHSLGGTDGPILINALSPSPNDEYTTTVHFHRSRPQQPESDVPARSAGHGVASAIRARLHVSGRNARLYRQRYFVGRPRHRADHWHRYFLARPHPAGKDRA